MGDEEREGGGEDVASSYLMSSLFQPSRVQAGRELLLEDADDMIRPARRVGVPPLLDDSPAGGVQPAQGKQELAPLCVVVCEEGRCSGLVLRAAEVGPTASHVRLTVSPLQILVALRFSEVRS
eukprot:118715-Hanusia_phi.AAC.1